MNARVRDVVFTPLQQRILELLKREAIPMEREDLQTRLCCASNNRFNDALHGLSRAGAVVYCGGSGGEWGLPRKRACHNPWAEK